MTFAELLLMALLGFGFYYALRPLQRRLERYFLSLLPPDRSQKRRTVIDINQNKKPYDH